MLPAAHRLSHRSEFSAVMRGGRRAGRSRLVVHALRRDGESAELPSRVGLVVSKAVGGSVVRHRISRKLRHVMRPVVASLPPGTDVVLRAHPSAATASSGELDADVRSGLRKLGFTLEPTPA
ncbi:ribonuclease P protein component [Rhodococcus sp. X156]|uniref:ribonuclease P protein component n=1 Tax=Rhodococcus sp. X156 TaxID=2499145 RepID=UPI000FDBC0D1|nr:ribonuclease P protein component [Rhodococcus sp. X156]